MEPIDTLLYVISLVFIFCSGYFVGYMNKGITININKDQTSSKDVEYNESLEGMLPPAIQEYYKKTNGFNDF